MSKTILKSKDDLSTVLVDGATVELESGTYKLDKDLNGINDKGEIVHTKDQLSDLLLKTIEPNEPAVPTIEEINGMLVDGAEIELDDVKYKINKDGNAVDAAGKVIKSKDELVTLITSQVSNEPVNPDPIIDYVTEIQKSTNLIPTSNGESVVYENTIAGMTQYAADVHELGREIGKQEYENALFEKYPNLPDILDYIAIHGNVEGFTNQPDYSKVTIGEDVAQWESLYITGQVSRGIPETEARQTMEYLKKDGKLKDAATSSLNYLNASQVDARTATANAVAKQKADEIAAETTYWNSVDKILTSKTLTVDGVNYKIPEVMQVKEADGKFVTKTSKDFLNYIKVQKPFVVDGQRVLATQYEYDEFIKNSKKTVHNELFDAYRAFTHYNDAQLIQAQVSNQQAKTVIKLKTKTSGASSSSDEHSPKLKLPIH